MHSHFSLAEDKLNYYRRKLSGHNEGMQVDHNDSASEYLTPAENLTPSMRVDKAVLSSYILFAHQFYKHQYVNLKQ